MGSIGLFPGIKHKLKLKDHTVNTHWTENTLLKTSAKAESHQGQIFIDVDSININSIDMGFAALDSINRGLYRPRIQRPAHCTAGLHGPGRDRPLRFLVVPDTKSSGLLSLFPGSTPLKLGKHYAIFSFVLFSFCSNCTVDSQGWEVHRSQLGMGII